MNIREWVKDNKEKIYNKLIFVLEILISLILGISIYKISYKYQDFKYISRPYLIIYIISCVCLLLILFFNTKKYKKTIEKLFLTYIIPIGIMFMIILPMNWVPDEEGHMFKTYDISMGNFITPFGENNEGDIYVPREMLELSEEYSKFNYSKLHQHMQKEADYNDLVPVQTIAKTYFPINYLSGAITFFACRLLNINILLACYLVRLVNFILFIIIGYYCIKIIPFGKLLLAIYMILPMIVHQSASLSADVFINAISLLFIAYNLKLLYQEKDISVKQKITYYLIALSISICKYVYFPIVFMSLLLIKNKNISKKNRNEVIIVSILASIFVALVWFVFSQKYVDVRQYIIQSNVKPIEQIKYILYNPLSYIKVLKDTLIENSGFYLFTFVGEKLGPLNIAIPQIYALIEMFALIVIPFFEKNEKSLDKYQKWLMIAIAIILIILILTGLYLTWTPLQEELISGVQGRYFVPVFILILLAMITKNKNIDIKNLETKYFVMFFILNILTLMEIYNIFI